MIMLQRWWDREGRLCEYPLHEQGDRSGVGTLAFCTWLLFSNAFSVGLGQCWVLLEIPFIGPLYLWSNKILRLQTTQLGLAVLPPLVHRSQLCSCHSWRGSKCGQANESVSNTVLKVWLLWFRNMSFSMSHPLLLPLWFGYSPFTATEWKKCRRLTLLPDVWEASHAGTACLCRRFLYKFYRKCYFSDFPIFQSYLYLYPVSLYFCILVHLAMRLFLLLRYFQPSSAYALFPST